MTDPMQDASLAFGTTTVELFDVLDFTHMAEDFAQGCDPGQSDIRFVVSGALETGWHMYAINTTKDGGLVVVMRRPLSELLFAHDETDADELDNMADPITNAAEYILVAMSSDRQEIKVSQGTCILDDDEISDNIWDEIDHRLFDSLPTP